MRRQIIAAARVVAIEASAPRPASRPDQMRRLAMSFVGIACILSDGAGGTALGARGVQSAADRLDDDRLRLVDLRVALRKRVEDPAGEDLLDPVVERQRVKRGRDGTAEGAVGL